MNQVYNQNKISGTSGYLYFLVKVYILYNIAKYSTVIVHIYYIRYIIYCGTVQRNLILFVQLLFGVLIMQLCQSEM